MVLEIFKIALGLRDRHVTINGNFERFQYLNFERDFLESENLFQKTVFQLKALRLKTRHFRRATRGRGRGGGGDLPCPFLKIKQSAPILGKKSSDSVYFWVKYSIQNPKCSFKNIQEKRLQNFPCGAFFLLFLTKFLLKCPNSAEPPLP